MKKRLIYTAVLAACTTFAVPVAIAQDEFSAPPEQETPEASGGMGGAQSARTPGQSGTTGQDQGAASSTGEQSDRMAAGRPSFDQLIRGDSLIGYEVVGSGGEEIGDVQDVAIGSDGKIEYVVVSMGGFLGIGDTKTLVRWQELSVTPDSDKVQLNVSKRELEQKWRKIELSDDDKGKLGFKSKDPATAG